MFVDRARIRIRSGRGGNGAVTFRREPFVPEGGPDGGDGGKGGDVIFEASTRYRTLMDFRYKRKYHAESGESGMKRKKYGKKGEDLVIMVPVGTVVIDEESGLVMKDLVHEGDRVIAARGGMGGKGNIHFKNSVRQAPNFAEAGGEPEERDIILELKLIADVGLVGFPNVGKSTFLSMSTSARPKIANYHFTTKTPNLGVVSLYDEHDFVIADIPGLIEGAHQGTGLGLDFLKHVERTRVLIHIVDVAGSEGRDPIRDFDQINTELEKYSDRLRGKPMLVVGNKIDILPENDSRILRFKKYVTEKGYRFFPMSAATGSGVKEVLDAAWQELEKLPDGPEIAETEFEFKRPSEDPEYREIKVSLGEDGVFELSGGQLYKIFSSTNFNDYGSLRYLYNYIKDHDGVKKMKKLGLKDGDTVRIKDFEFVFEEE